METYTQEQISFIKSQVAEHGDNMAFYFVPSARLRALILQGEHPNIKALPAAYVSLFLEGKAVVIENQMIIDYLQGTGTARNAWLLDLGEIRVATNTFKVQKTDSWRKSDIEWENIKPIENKRVPGTEDEVIIKE
jgi:hypothetical protein